eukprot:190722-Hanusia_phi.AAC.3
MSWRGGSSSVIRESGNDRQASSLHPLLEQRMSWHLHAPASVDNVGNSAHRPPPFEMEMKPTSSPALNEYEARRGLLSNSVNRRPAPTEMQQLTTPMYYPFNQSMARKEERLQTPVKQHQDLQAGMAEGDMLKPPNSGLPRGWEMKLDSPSGKVFYVNHSLRAISWERPKPEKPTSLQREEKQSSESRSFEADQMVEKSNIEATKLPANRFVEERPVVPTSFVEERPVVPSSFVEERPVIPTSLVEERPVVPTRFVEERPVLATSIVEERQVFPTSFVEERPVLATSFIEERQVFATSFVAERPFLAKNKVDSSQASSKQSDTSFDGSDILNRISSNVQDILSKLSSASGASEVDNSSRERQEAHDLKWRLEEFKIKSSIKERISAESAMLEGKVDLRRVCVTFETFKGDFSRSSREIDFAPNSKTWQNDANESDAHVRTRRLANLSNTQLLRSSLDSSRFQEFQVGKCHATLLDLMSSQTNLLTHSSTSNIPSLHKLDKKDNPHMDTLTLLLDAREKVREYHMLSLTAEYPPEPPLSQRYLGRSFDQEIEYMRWVEQELRRIPVDEDELGNTSRSDMETTMETHTSRDTTQRNSDKVSSSDGSSSASHLLTWQV